MNIILTDVRVFVVLGGLHYEIFGASLDIGSNIKEETMFNARVAVFLGSWVIFLLCFLFLCLFLIGGGWGTLYLSIAAFVLGLIVYRLHKRIGQGKERD